MPYFERKPWLETVKDTANLPPAASMVEDEHEIAEIARQVLSAESGPRHVMEGPYRCRKVLAPGEQGSVTLEVSADSNGGPMSLHLAPDDMRNQNGETIPANRVNVKPAQLEIAPGSSARVVVEILVPLDANAGLYKGRIVASGSESARFLIEVEVGSSTA